MAKFWIDTSVFLEASLGSLAFDLNPEFWDQIEADARAGIVRSPMFVYRELVDLSGRDDWVAQWAVRMKGEGILFEEPDALALASFTQIADYIHRFTDPSEGDAFLD